MPSFGKAARRPRNEVPGAACPGVPPTVPPGLGRVVGGQRAHQLMLLLQLGLPVLAPLVPQLQLSHQGLALLAQSLLVFDQLQRGVEVRLLPCEAGRPSLPSPRRPAHQILSLALPPGLREDPESWGAHTWTRATAAQASIPLGPGWCQQRSDSASGLGYKAPTVATPGASWNRGHSVNPITWPVEKGLPTACQGVSTKPPGQHPASWRTPGRPLICRHLWPPSRV